MANDPWEEPPGYAPPRSARELLERYQRGERYFEGAWLDWAELPEVELPDVNLSRASLCGASLEWASLQGANFQECNLAGASLYGSELSLTTMSLSKLEGAKLSMAGLHGADLSLANLKGADLMGARLKGANLSLANLKGANLQDADMSLANLQEVDLEGVNLCGANLGEALGEPQDRSGCRVDHQTYRASGWTPDVLVEWHQAGAEIEGLDEFPADVREALSETRQGLTLFLLAEQSRLERFALEGLLLGLSLRRPHAIAIDEFHQRPGGQVVARLVSSSPQELERLGDALHRRFWQQPPARRTQVEDESLSHLKGVMTDEVLDVLSRLMDGVARMELHFPDEEGNLRQLQSWGTPPVVLPWNHDAPGEKTGVHHRDRLEEAAAPRRRHGELAEAVEIDTQVSMRRLTPEDTVLAEEFQSFVQAALKALVEFREDLEGRMQRFERYRLHGALEEAYRLPVHGLTLIESHALLEELWLMEAGEHLTMGLRRFEGTRIMDAMREHPVGRVLVKLALGEQEPRVAR
ncbi:MAG: hypothetical protein CMH57_14250 [Myxococcales bacterium]|nr:hypothetical protein [Myxococcales bacterium]